MTAVLIAFVLATVEPTEQVDGEKPDEFVTSDDAVADAGPLPHPNARAETVVFERTNTLRQREGLQPVVRSDTLDRTAQWFAEFMARTGQYGHEADGRTASDRIASSGYESCSTGENIAYRRYGGRYGGGRQSQPVVGKDFYNAWQNSPGHRANMLTGSFTETGIGLARSGSGTYFAVQLFGRPSSAMVVVEVENRSGRDVTMTVQAGGLERSATLRHRSRRSFGFCDTTKLTIGDLEPVSIETSVRYVVREDEGQLTLDPSGKPHELSKDD